MENQIVAIRKQFQADLDHVKDLKSLELLKIRYFGKKGIIQDLMTLFRSCSPAERPKVGKQINDLKESLLQVCEQLQRSLQQSELSAKMAGEQLDVTLPGRSRQLGRGHPIAEMLAEVTAIFSSMGFSVQYGPDIDSDYYNYEGLNFPPDHPAREMQDTFYLSTDYLLRSHTSNTQLRVMETYPPPIRIIAPGTVFRNEEVTTRSHVFFHQLEGLYVDKHVTFADLFATMELFCFRLFRQEIAMRFRPSFFPFVEPGVEVDIRCTHCNGTGCRLCKDSGWLEVLGAGLVHPQVLKNGGIDPEQYSGYAWGMGIERLTMLRYGIKDIRLFADNDVRFLQQFHA